MNRISYQGESLVDVCIRSYADISNLFGLMAGNGLPADAQFGGGEPVVLQTALVNRPGRVEQRQRVLKAAKDTQVIVYAGQNLPDLALQEYGGVEGLFTLMSDNGLALDADFVPGAMLRISPVKTRADVVEYYRRTNYRVNTGAAILVQAQDAEYNEDYNIDYNA